MQPWKFTMLPAAIALSLMLAPVAFAGSLETPEKPSEPEKVLNPPDKTPNPTPPPRPQPQQMGGGSSSNDPTIACRIGNRLVYTTSWRQCKELKYSLGYGQGHGGGSVVVGGGYAYGGGYATGGGGYGYYQPQRVIRYVAMPSRAVQMQAEKRARRAARRAAEAYGYGYGDGGMVGYGNGVMVGGYGNNVVVNGNVYGGAYGYAGGGYASGGQQVYVQHKRKHKRARRAMYQQPGYYVQPGMMMQGYGYNYSGGCDCPTLYKGGGY